MEALSNLSLSTSPMRLKSGRRFQHVRTVQASDTPWHLHSRTILFLTALERKEKKKENVRYKRIGNCVVQVLSGPTKEAFENGLCYIILGARFYLPSYEGGGGGWWGWGRCTVEGKGIRDLGTLLPQISL